MKKSIVTKLLGGAALASLLLNSATAYAQVAPGQPAQQSAPAPTPSPTSSQPQTVRPRSLIVAPSALTGGVRAARQGDNDIGVVEIDDYLKRWPAATDEKGRPIPGTGIAGFEAIERENQSACAHTGEYVRRSITIIARSSAIDDRLQGLYPGLVQLGEGRTGWAFGQ